MAIFATTAVFVAQPGAETISSIADFTDAEQKVVQRALRERYGTPVELELAEVELNLDPVAPVLTTCPAVYWSARGAHFIVAKTGAANFRPQFFYDAEQLYWTGRTEYESLLDATLEILRAQADHERETQSANAGAADVRKDAQ